MPHSSTTSLFLLLLLLVVPIAAIAACPSSTPYTVTAAETISGCTITNIQVVVNTGGCSVCAFAYTYNTVANLANNLVPITFTSMSPGGSVTITNNNFKVLPTNTVELQSSVNLASVAFYVAFNTVQYTVAANTGYYMVTFASPQISGVSTVTISSNTMTFTGSQTMAAGVPIFQFYLNVITPLLTVYLDDNVLDVSGIQLTGTTVDPATVYQGASIPYIHAIIGNFINNVAAAYYPTVYCRRNTIRSFPTTTWTRVAPNLLRFTFQDASMNPITVSDNQIIVSCAVAQIADLVALIVEFDSHTIGGTVTITNNRITISSVKGLTHTMSANTVDTNGPLTVNGALFVRNNSIYVHDISSAAATISITQILTSTIGHVTGPTNLSVAIGANLSVTDNTVNVSRMSLWVRTGTNSGNPDILAAIVWCYQITTSASSLFTIASNTLLTDETYRGLSTDGGSTFTAASPLVDVDTYIVGPAGINTAASSTFNILSNVVVANASGFQSYKTGILLSSTSAVTISGALSLDHNVLGGFTSSITSPRIGVLFTNYAFTFTNAAVSMQHNTLFSVDTADSSIRLAVVRLEGTPAFTVAATSTMSISSNTLDHVSTNSLNTLTTLFSTSAATIDLSAALTMASNNISFTALGDLTTLDALLAASTVMNTTVTLFHASDLSTITVRGSGSINVTSSSVTVATVVPRPSLYASFLHASSSATVTVAGIMAVHGSRMTATTVSLCRVWDWNVVGGLWIPGTAQVSGTVTLDSSSVVLSATDDTTVAGPSGTSATCANKGTTYGSLLRLATSGSGRVMCTNSTLSATLGGRTLLRAVVRLAEVQASSGSVTFSVGWNTMTISAATPLSTLNTTAIQAAFGITPTTMCGGSGLVSASMAASASVSSGPIVSVVSNTITTSTTAEMWGGCSAVHAIFAGSSVTAPLVDVSNNVIRVISNTSSSLSGPVRMVTLTGSASCS